MGLLESAWKLLPDECEVDECCRKGVRGNENRIPFPGIAEDFYIIMCDYCSMRYDRGEPLVIKGLPLQLLNPKSKVVCMLAAKRKKRGADNKAKAES